MLVYEETANDLHRELSCIEKKPPFCLCARANHALRNKDAQCKTEESLKYICIQASSGQL